jgi:hypothetical protein
MGALAVLEVVDRDGRVRSTYPVHAWPVRVGRSLDCDVILDDPHVAAHHFTLDAAPAGGVTLAVGETVNGVQCGRQRLAAGSCSVRQGGEEWVVGHTRLRLRLREDALAPELPLPRASRWSLPALAALLLGVVGWSAWDTYLNADPGEFLSQFMPVTAGMLAMVAAWSFLWALGTKLFQHRLAYLVHVRIAAAALLALGMVSAALGVLAFMTSFEFLSRIRGVVEVAIAALAIYAHLGVVMPQRRRVFAWMIGAGAIAGVSLTAWLQYQRTGRLTDELYLTTLPPPALRLAPAVPPEVFIDEARRLQASLDRKAADADDAVEHDSQDEE